MFIHTFRRYMKMEMLQIFFKMAAHYGEVVTQFAELAYFRDAVGGM
jgi:hypothetical protein